MIVDRAVSCADEPPPGSILPPAMPSYSGGACPALAPGMNTIASGGANRQFQIVLPSDYDPATDRLPVLFMWHYLGGSSGGMITNGTVQAAADAERFIAVVPEKKGDLPIPFSDNDWCWPYLTTHSQSRVDEELRFFDDMLACVAEQYAINDSCVSSVGVSAGALWTSRLLQLRSDRLASAIVISGGVGPASPVSYVDVPNWVGAPRPMPVMVVWGGAGDSCVLDFDTASRNLIGELASNGHAIESCIHNCGHSVPPVDDPQTGLAVLYRFALDHPYWLVAGETPYRATGLPDNTPSWCALGDTAVERVGECTSDHGADCPQI
jgi:predicted esterase